MTAFSVDVQGLAELEGGRDPQRLAFEPIANVFDEYRGYRDGQECPTYCHVQTRWQAESPRGTWLEVVDDGPGFERPEDIWTLFGHTAKRYEPHVAGRFNAGDKQLLAVAREARVETATPEQMVTVDFRDGERSVTRHRTKPTQSGTTVRALMPWSRSEALAVSAALGQVIAPIGLIYTVNGQPVEPTDPHTVVRVTAPTVGMSDGVLRPTTRKTFVEVRQDTIADAWLFELGMPVCSIADSEFRYSLNVMQKVPVPMSRDSVTPAYLHQLIGRVVEAAAMDGVMLLSEEDESAAHLKRSLEWVRKPEALKAAVDVVFGEDAVRQSPDAAANARAMLDGRAVVSGGAFGPDTRRRLRDIGAMRTSHSVYVGASDGAESAARPGAKCPECGHEFTL